MSRAGGLKFSCIFAGMLLATALLPGFLEAGPVGLDLETEVGEDAPESAAVAPPLPHKLVRNRRNAIGYRQTPDFWAWYKYFMDSGNQDGVKDLDRVYLAYLQNKHRVEGGHSFDHYLHHLREIYRTCANSDDPECITEFTSKPKAELVMPRTAPVMVCDPYRDPYCLFKGGAPAPAPAPASVKGPLPILTPVLPLPGKAPSGYYSYAPILEPFLPAEQREELLRICNPSDVECLQYHLRAAYGYKPAIGPLPSYVHLGCDPSKDPYCIPKLVQKAPSGLYHLYPTCDPDYDPFCAPSMAPSVPQTAQGLTQPPREQSCNPLFDENCNPLTATKLASLTKPVLEYTPKEQPAPNVACDPHYDPYCLLGVPAAQFSYQPRNRLGIRGKTKEGYDCYMFYDKECLLPGFNSDAPEGQSVTKEQDQDRPTLTLEDLLRGYTDHYARYNSP